MNKKRKKKTLMLSLLVAAGMLLSTNLSAQEQHGRPGGLFGEQPGTSQNSSGLMDLRGTVGVDINGQGFGETNGDITGQTFGTPLGSGLFVLLAAGVGYSALKTKKKQNKK